MCYRDDVPPLYFDNIHLACLCGDNGNGKSALVDAITWAVWGSSRAKSDDELICLGEREMWVDFEFRVASHHYRVFRRHRKGSGNRPGQTRLDFEIASPEGFHSINSNSLRGTQQKITNILHMDYHTFINSALLRQGHADEFTIKRPGERKEILANILGLSYYAQLEEKAKELAKERQQTERELSQSIKELEPEISQKESYQIELERLKKELTSWDEKVALGQAEVIRYREARKDLLSKKEHLSELEREIESGEKDLIYWQSQIDEHRRKQDEYQNLLLQAEEIESGYLELQKIKQENEAINAKLAALVGLNQLKANLEQTIERAKGEILADKRLAQQKIEELKIQQQQEIQAEAELSQVNLKLTELDREAEEFSQKRKFLEELSLQIQLSKSTRPQLKAEVKTLREKIELLAQSETSQCPLCETELGLEGKQKVAEKYQADIASKLEAEQHNEKEIKEKERQEQELSSEIDQFEKQINQERLTGQKHLAILQEQISQAQAAQSALSEAEKQLTELEAKLTQEDFASVEQAQLSQIKEQIAVLGYDASAHQRLRERLSQLSKYEPLKPKLDEAKKQLPSEKKSLTKAKEAFARLDSALMGYRQKIATFSQEIAALPDLETQLNRAEQNYQLCLKSQAGQQKELGAIQQRLQNCLELEKTKTAKQKTLLEASQEKQIYSDLAEAFGKGGIPALLIEAVIPEIEQEANRLLARMTDNRLQVELKTQRETKKGNAIETLEIKIADELGSRSYEMYSGGEAFRINLAIRLALSKLLARRAGAPLPVLFIDEGFGTQDTAGLSKMVEAISSIQDDFEKIIVITHLEELRDAFPVRIEVRKTSQGSTISVN
jgi:exonuclease SbcC